MSMDASAMVVAGALGTSVIAAASLCRARAELTAQMRLSFGTTLFVVATYTNLTVGIVLTALFSVWPMTTDSPQSRLLGVILVVIGAVLYIAARTRLRSFRQTWGLELDTLVIGGVYRFTRNPQAIGAVMLLGGMAIWGRSAAALTLVALHAVVSWFWIRAEEQVLERRFGQSYQAYRNCVPRFIRTY